MKISRDEEKIYEKIFDLYSQNAEYPSEEELLSIKFSPDFEERIKSVIYSRKTLKAHNYKGVMQRVAGVFVVLALMAGSFAVGTFAEPANPQKKVKDIIEIYESVIFETEKPRSCYYGFSYIIEGYKEYGGGGSRNYISQGYKNENGEKIFLIQYKDELPIPAIDRFADVHEKIDGGLYVLNTNTGASSYIWSDLGYVFEVRADNCSKEELLKMCDSLVRI